MSKGKPNPFKESEDSDEEQIPTVNRERVLEKARKEYELLQDVDKSKDPKAIRDYIKHALRDIFGEKSKTMQSDSLEEIIDEIIKEDARLVNEGCELNFEGYHAEGCEINFEGYQGEGCELPLSPEYEGCGPE